MSLTALIVLVCAVPQADRQAFHIEPYLQFPERNAITVMWETAEPSRGKVRYGTTPQLDLVASASEDRTVHEVRLTDLLPSTRYFYQVKSGACVSDVASFRTAPGPGERCRVVVYGDSRSFPDRHQRITELAAQYGPNLVVHTGDQVTRGTQRPLWKAQFFDPAASLWARVPVITSLGNHEDNAGNYFEYLALPGNERYFGFDFGDLHLVILDSNMWGQSARDSEQYKWLRQHLSQPRSTKWVAIAFHHPLFSAHDKRSINPARWDWWPAFEELGVDVVLTGHDHFYYRSWPIGRLGMQSSRGIPHITTAGGGAPLYKMKTRSYTAVEQSIHHISVLDIDGNSIQARVVDDSGRTIDEFEINKQPTPPSQFCAYEVYDLERAIRAELESRAPLILETDATTAVVQDELRVVHGFRVPVSARVSWDGDSASGAVVRLEPGEPLIIPISRRIALDPISKTGAAVAAARLPLVQLDFLDERFRNRRIEFSPLKFCKDLTVRAEALEGAPRMSQLLDGTALRRQKSIQFVRSDATQRAVIPVQMQTARFADRLAAVFTINGIRTNPVTELEAAPAVASDLLRTHHVRWVISNGMHTYAWAVNIDGGRAESKDGDWSFEEPDWSAFVRRRPSSCTIAVVLPMALLEGGDDLRINVVHVDPGTSVESCLSPTFDIGSDPDRIPDFRFGDRTVSRFARLMLP